MRTLLIGGLVLILIGGIYIFTAGGAAPKRFALSSYRHHMMETIGHTAAALEAATKGIVPAEEGHVLGNAIILANAAKLSKATFVEDTRGVEGKSDSKDAIWENWDDFSTQIDKFEADTSALVAALSAGDEGAAAAAMKAVNDSCGKCHETYRH